MRDEGVRVVPLVVAGEDMECEELEDFEADVQVAWGAGAAGVGAGGSGPSAWCRGLRGGGRVGGGARCGIEVASGDVESWVRGGGEVGFEAGLVESLGGRVGEEEGRSEGCEWVVQAVDTLE